MKASSAILLGIGTLMVGAVIYQQRNYSIDTGALANPNVKAFLDAIGNSEDAWYNTLYGGGIFTNYSTHPYLNGWPGVKLSDAYCKAAGLSAGCITTAAGKYQITVTTFKRIALKLGLTDFEPLTQDLIAVDLLDERGALQDIYSGNIRSAIAKANKEWASLPGAQYGQPTANSDNWIAYYQSKGGNVA